MSGISVYESYRGFVQISENNSCKPFFVVVRSEIWFTTYVIVIHDDLFHWYCDNILWFDCSETREYHTIHTYQEMSGISIYESYRSFVLLCRQWLIDWLCITTKGSYWGYVQISEYNSCKTLFVFFRSEIMYVVLQDYFEYIVVDSRLIVQIFVYVVLQDYFTTL